MIIQTNKAILSDMAARSIGYLVLCAVLAWSCSKDPDPVNSSNESYVIRSITYNGKTHNRFIYNAAGKITEYQSFYFYYRYTYNEKGILIKEESAFADEMNPSDPGGKNELLTAQNSVFTGYSLYLYEHDSLLKQKIYYHKNNGKYELVSKSSFEYVNGNIVKWNIHTANDTITQYYTYEYDNNRNVIMQKQYSYLSGNGHEPVLVRETTYTYDDKHNPFIIFRHTASPGVFTNTNNVIETRSTLFVETAGIPKYTQSTSSYEYNLAGYPRKAGTGSSAYVYIYY